MPAISVVIPLFNQGATVERAITSVLRQTVTDWELVVVDDGSTDRGPEVVARFSDPRISVVRQTNQGVSVARNHGIRRSVAAVVAFLDADDHWAPDHLDNLTNLIAEFPSASVYASAYQVVSEDGRARPVRLRAGKPRRALLADYFVEAAELEPPIQTSGVAVRKPALDAIGGFPTGVRTGQDLITWARLVCRGALAYSTHATTYYVVPPISARRRLASVRRPESPDYVGEALRRLAAEHPDRSSSLSAFRAMWHRLRAMTYAELGERRLSLRELWTAIALGRPKPHDALLAGMIAVPEVVRTPLLAVVRHRNARARIRRSYS
jgi:glycosyltransferase involved in cell wall biosynthesis